MIRQLNYKVEGFQVQNQFVLLVKIYMKLFLCLVKQQIAETFGGLVAQFELFLTCALYVDERLA